MIGEVCVFSEKLFIPHWERKSLHVKIYEYDENAETFTQIFRLCVNPGKDNVKKCSIRAVGDDLSGIISVYAIVQYESNEVNIFSCTECFGSFELVKLESFSSAVILCSSINDILLADGPQLVIANGSKLCFHSPEARTCYDMQKILHMPISCCRILNFSIISRHRTCREAVTVYILVVSCSGANPCKERVQFLTYFRSSAEGVPNADLSHIKTSLFFPITFSSAITAVDVHVKHPGVPQSDSPKEFVSQLPWIENRTILCTKKQCLVFCRSFLQYSCSIPYSDVRCIFPLPVYSCESHNMNIILQSSSSGVCCLKIENNVNHMKCVQEWKGAQRAAVGCILGNGAKQLLLFCCLDPDNWQSECCIADMNLSPPCNGRSEDFSGTSSSTDYLRNAVIGLQKRAMAGKASVTELQYKISEKQAVTNEILRKLHGHSDATDSVISDKNVSFFQESLVDILPLNDPVSVKSINEKELKAAMKITGHWKTVLRSNYIFGWTLENVSDSCIVNPKVHLVLENTSEKAIQKLFVHQSEGLPCQPRLSDPTFEQVVFKHGDMLSLVLCFAIPAFLTDVISASFIISWCEHKAKDSPDFCFASTLGENALQQITTKSTVAVTDVLEKQPLQGLSVVQQLMSFRVLQQRTILFVSSMYSDLSTFDETIKSSDHPDAPVLINHLGMKILVFTSPQSPLYGINMTWRQISKSSIEITIYCRNEKEVIFFTQWMYSALPDDVLALPRNMKVKEASEMRNKILVSMKSEIDLILGHLSSAGCTTAQVRKMGSDKGGSERFQTNENHACDKIVFSKEKFRAMRESLLKSELLTDSIIKKIA